MNKELQDCLKHIKQIEDMIDRNYRFLGVTCSDKTEAFANNNNMSKIKHNLCNLYCKIENLIKEENDK